jgi:predicted alpha/beta-hydrolase family hydrolase
MNRPVRSVVLLWHGSGPGESDVMQPLATALAHAGHRAVAIDWDSRAADHGREALLASLRDAREQAAGSGAPLVVAGWSLGGTAATSLAVPSPGEPAVDAVVGLAVDFRAPSPLDNALLMDAASLVRPVRLVHGTQDPLIPADRAAAFAANHPVCELRLIDTDHAGVIGAAWDAALDRCLPSSSVGAQAGLAAAVAAVESALGG